MLENGLEKKRLTAIILTLNNADTIRNCIESVAWADEVLVYDSGSSDEAQGIVNSLGARLIVDSEWLGFGLQRQKAQKNAEGQWVLWVDSDEVVSPTLKENIQSCLPSASQKQLFSVNRTSDFFGRFIRHSGWHPDRVIRLYSRTNYQYNDAPVHEQVDCSNQFVTPLVGDLLHYTSNSFFTYMSKSLRYADVWAKEKYSQGGKVSVLGIILRTKFAFFRKFFLQKGFLDGKHGLLLAIQSSHYTFNKYFALWALCQKEGPEKSASMCTKGR